MSAIDGSVSGDKSQSAAALFDRAEAFALSGDFERAIALYREVLKERPDYPSAQRKLASALQSSGSVEEAAAGYRIAIALDPGDARALDELGRLLGHRGDMRAAIEHLRAAVRLDPHLASARGALGDALCRQGLWGEGIAELEAARASDPNSWPLNLRLGTALGAAGPERLDAAMDCFRRVIALVPGHAMAHIHLGMAFWKRGDTAPAIALAERATRLDPQLAAAHGALGSMLYGTGRHEEAIASLRAALALAPNDVTACLYLGVCLCRVPGGRAEEGVKFLRRAIELDPRQIEAHIQLGAILAYNGYRDQALASYQAALALFPDDPTLQLGATVAELPIVCDDEAELERSRARYATKLESLSGFFESRRAGPQAPAGAAMRDAQAVGSAQPFFLPYQGRDDRALQARYGAMVAGIMTAAYPQWASLPDVAPPAPHEPIRVGIVSGHFWGHSVLKVPIWGWVALLDRRRFHLFGYHAGSYQDGETSRVRRYFHRFVQGPLAVERWCETIRADAPHVLIFPEIGMDQMMPKLAGLRLAPIQCVSQGHPVTSGFPTIDYYLGSALMEPEDGDAHYTERLVRLPNLGVAYVPPPIVPSTLGRQALGLRAEATAFLCCQHLPKYLPQFDGVFPDIARRVGDAQFVFIGSPRGAEITARFQRRLGRAFAAAGLDVSRHVVMLSPMTTADFMGVARLCDVFLDSIGWSGYNSTLECLACDLPIVTWPGPLMRGRHSYAILRMLGVTETIAASATQYVDIAVRLARDPAWRMAIRGKIAASRSSILADPTPVRALEDWLDQVVRPPPAAVAGASSPTR
jgi:protein O-GlcNAc transferase